ncbi:hypothetical protein L7F22_019383 [Adiantum nelumboides]|nr:hypothetical protein [Adiantum nelumboides]
MPKLIEVIANDRLGRKVRVKCSPDDTVGDLKKLIAAQTGTTPEKIQLKKWYTVFKDHITLSDSVRLGSKGCLQATQDLFVSKNIVFFQSTSFHTSTRIFQQQYNSASSSDNSSNGSHHKDARYIQTPSFPPPSFPKSFGANQVVPLDLEMTKRFDRIIKSFPEPIRFAFAYGSGVFPQSQAGPEHSSKPTTKEGKKMIDLVMAVNHPQHWHGINMKQNSKHYSWLAKLLGSLGIGFIQPLGAGLWYHPYIRIEDELIKYGVMDIDTLCSDLLDWDTLYISGRMHKPVTLLATDARARLAQQVNLASALRTALLLLPEQFGEAELYTRIASLSYTGDFRMSVPGGENANKVRNIVLNQREMFRRLYGSLIRSIETISVEETRKNRFTFTQDYSVKVRAKHASKLPLRLREKIQQHYTSHPDMDDAFLQLSLSSRSDNVARMRAQKQHI